MSLICSLNILYFVFVLASFYNGFPFSLPLILELLALLFEGKSRVK